MQSLKSPPSPPMRSRDRRPPRPRSQPTVRNSYLLAVVDAFWQFNPKAVTQNPVMFLVFVAMLVMLVLTVQPSLFGHIPGNHPRLYNGLICGILFFTIWLANLTQSIASGRSKAKAKYLQSLKNHLVAKKLAADGSISEVPADSLRCGDTIYAIAGDVIPCDGEVTMGTASVDESSITGESVPILKEAGADSASSVTGGTRIIADELIIRVTANPGEGFIDRVIALLAAKKSAKTPNEIFITVLLGLFSCIFLLVTTTLVAWAIYLQVPLTVPSLIALLVSLLPTTIAGLMTTVRIAAIERVTQLNAIATSASSVEICGEINTLVLDKTGTITQGNRQAEEFIPINGHSLPELAQAALIASLFDDTTEGKSIVRLAQRLGATIDFDPKYAQAIPFSRETRISGTNLANGITVYKGAVNAIQEFTRFYHGTAATELESIYQRISEQGGTPLAVAIDNDVYGVIYLKDIIKPGIRDRLAKLRQIGVRVMMVTGDNAITAGVIAHMVGIDDFVAEATPADKFALIQSEQAAGKIVAMVGDGNDDTPALAQANVGLAMNTGTPAVKQAASIIDLDSNPTKIINLVEIGKQIITTRAALILFSLTNDIGKYLAMMPMIFVGTNLQGLNFLRLGSLNSTIFATLIYNALAIIFLSPLAFTAFNFPWDNPNKLQQCHLIIFGFGGIITPLILIKLLDLILTAVGVV
ncbi:potassium-transporting ATPase subunit KdpB [Calothrix sp. NIES-3974]|uniref:potassium-transporting ATPase subunit KdpB n=1 Tax=Calothrix sp. NIES-3974 TaxID=2005462 RepID=UPI000BBBE44B|nr:potassium-transporting ATPase subunit KdpB [Calothrix sp. NIES-3974]